MNKLVLIDGHAVLHRAFHAIPQLTNKTGQPVNAVYGLVSMVIRVINDLSPSHLVVCFDRPEPTFRKKEFKAYQSQRPETDKGLSSQFDIAKEVVKAFNIPLFEKVGYEADDLLGTISKIATECSEIDEVVIVTGDRDILQLVNDKTFVYMPIKGLIEAKLMKEDDVVKKMGVKPTLIPDYKALVGDPSDNYPGVTGIGPKTAVDLINNYGSVDEIYKHLDEIPQKVKEKLRNGSEDVKIYHRLATIVQNVKINFELDDSAKWSLYNPKVQDLFSKLGFKTFTERVKKIGRQMEMEKQLGLI